MKKKKGKLEKNWQLLAEVHGFNHLIIISCNLIFIDLLAFPTTSQKWWLQPLRNGYTRVTILKILAEYIWVLKNVHSKFHSPIPQYNWSNGRNHGCFWEGVCNTPSKSASENNPAESTPFCSTSTNINTAKSHLPHAELCPVDLFPASNKASIL